MSWTDERVELLKKLWADGLSASQIAAELGGITRNAVIGKVHRLGLSGRAKSTSSAAPRPRKVRSASHMLRIGRASIRGNTALAHAYDIEAEAEPELIDNIIPIGQRRTLLELNEQTCRWPVGDPGSQRIFLLRRQYHSRPALLRLSLAGGLSARRRSPRQAAGEVSTRHCEARSAAAIQTSPPGLLPPTRSALPPTRSALRRTRTLRSSHSESSVNNA